MKRLIKIKFGGIEYDKKRKRSKKERAINS